MTKTISASEAKQNFGRLLNDVLSIDVTIEKANKPYAVVLSSERYKRLTELEDLLYGKAAELAAKEGYLSPKDSQDLLDSID